MSVPAAGAGSSTSTLSVEISTIVSSAATASPGCLCHSRIVPSVTDSPACGVTMSTTLPSAAGAAGAPLPWASTWSASLVAASAACSVPGTGSPSTDVSPPSAVAGASPLTLIWARTCPTSTVSPSATRILAIVPAAGEGTSASTLSVETSTSVSSASTASPTALRHSRMVPSVTDSPIWGIVTSIVVPTAIFVESSGAFPLRVQASCYGSRPRIQPCRHRGRRPPPPPPPRRARTGSREGARRRSTALTARSTGTRGSTRRRRVSAA